MLIVVSIVISSSQIQGGISLVPKQGDSLGPSFLATVQIDLQPVNDNIIRMIMEK